MATKKKKKDNKKRKYNGPKKKYSLRVLVDIVKATDEKIDAGEAISDYDLKLYSAAKQTVDLIRSTDNKKLDLSRDSESYLDEALAKKGVSLQGENIEEEQIVKTLVETGASYLLFEQINLLTSFGVVGDVHYDSKESDNLMIKAHLFMNPNIVFFDPYKVMSDVADTCFIFHDVSPSQMGIKDAEPDDVVRAIAVNLDAYRDIFSKELLEAL